MLQNQPELKPINWYEGITPKEIQERMIHFIELQTTEFQNNRFEYLKTLTEIVQCENSLVDIRKNEIEKETTRICSNTLCNSVYVIVNGNVICVGQRSPKIYLTHCL